MVVEKETGEEEEEVEEEDATEVDGEDRYD